MSRVKPSGDPPPADGSPVVSVALVGNPNTGKSTLFGALVGSHQRVGNYPGVTVEKKTGEMTFAGRRYEIVDLPGLYSLAPHSRDEMVVVDLLLGRRKDAPPVDVVLCILDAANLYRGLYLLGQLLELGLPTVVALNKLDVARKGGLTLDIDEMQTRLPAPVVAIQANRRIGISDLTNALSRIRDETPVARMPIFPEVFDEEVTRLAPSLDAYCGKANSRGLCSRWLAERLLLDANGYLEGLVLDGNGSLKAALRAARERLATGGCPVPDIEPEVRYEWTHRLLDGVLTSPERRPTTATDRIDRVLTHPVWGAVIFAILMLVIFQSVFVGAAPLVDWIDGGFAALGNGLIAAMAGTSLAGGALESLLVKGILGGVGGVLSFLPQILILFFFIAIPEGCGYMARAAFLMDKVMVRVGLNGKSFIPLLSSFACAIPGIMATRVIGNERDRLTTILVAPLMTCSARLPVYALLIAAFVPRESYAGGLLNLQGLTLAGLYLLGIVAAIAVALLLKRTLLRGPSPPFLMELPSYEWPSARAVAHRVVQRAWIFVRTAGGAILAVSVLAWAALYYPRDAATVEGPFQTQRQAIERRLATIDSTSNVTNADARRTLEADLAQLNREIQGAYERQSYLARMGRAIEPAVRPLGWDWRIGSAVIASFPAREAVVATLGVIFNLGDQADAEEDEAATHLTAQLRAATWEGTDRPLFTVPVALSIMVFFALCAQCVATLAVIRRETNSWRWPAFAFGYMTALAYVGAMATYQLGTWLGNG
jgi:ferrous iron transport protein B